MNEEPDLPQPVVLPVPVNSPNSIKPASKDPSMPVAGGVFASRQDILLGLSWIVLCAGRSILVPLFLAAGVLSPSMVSDLDDRILIRCYLALLAVTIAVLVLRAMRGERAHVTHGQPEDTPALENPQSVPAMVTDRRPDSRA